MQNPFTSSGEADIWSPSNSVFSRKPITLSTNQARQKDEGPWGQTTSSRSRRSRSAVEGWGVNVFAYHTSHSCPANEISLGLTTVRAVKKRKRSTSDESVTRHERHVRLARAEPVDETEKCVPALRSSRSRGRCPRSELRLFGTLWAVRRCGEPRVLVRLRCWTV